MLQEFKWIREIDDETLDKYVRKTEAMLTKLYDEDEGDDKKVKLFGFMHG